MYAEFISDYSDLADDFITNTTEFDYYNEYAPASINFVAEEKEDLYIGSIITDFDLGTPYIRGDMTLTIDGEVFRRGGFSFGWVMFGFGILMSAISIYSLITYSSKDEIQRYEEQISQFNNNIEREQQETQNKE